MIYLCHLLVFILPGGCCQRRGLLFFFYNVTAPSPEKRLPVQEKKRGKNSASKQIRPEPLKRSGCVQDPFSLRVNQMMRRHAQICITSVLVPFCAQGPCASLKIGAAYKNTPIVFFCCLLHRLDPEIMRDASFLSFFIDYLLFCSLHFCSRLLFVLQKNEKNQNTHTKKPHRLVYISLSPNLAGNRGPLLYIK